MSTPEQPQSTPSASTAPNKKPGEEAAPALLTFEGPHESPPAAGAGPLEEPGFKDVVALGDLKEGEMAPFTVDGVSMVLVLLGGEVHALGGKCPHRGAPMAQGAACHSLDHGPVVVCPWHKAVFSAATGALEQPPAFAPLPRYPVRVQVGRVQVRPVPLPVPEAPPTGGGQSVLVLGGGAAAASALYTLRELGFAGTVTLVHDEPELPYDRTVLCKSLLLADPKRIKAPLLLDKDWYAAHGVRCVHGHVTRFDAQTRRASLDDGLQLTASHVILAMGGQARMVPVPGCTLEGVYVLHNQAQARRIAATVTPDQAVVLVGGDLVCLEVAATLRQKGVGVTVVAPHPLPVAATFTIAVANRLVRLHEENGVAFVFDADLKAIYGAGSVFGVELSDGMRIPCTHVLVGAGELPQAEAVAGVEKSPEGAVVVDESMKAASHVYAVGDMASIRRGSEGGLFSPGHWRPAEIGGRVAALSIMGSPVRDLPVPWFWTQQYGRRVEYCGWGEPFDAVEVRGSLESFDFMAFCWQGSRVVGLVACGHTRAMCQAVVDFDRFVRDEAPQPPHLRPANPVITDAQAEGGQSATAGQRHGDGAPPSPPTLLPNPGAVGGE
ncbi:Rieske 2Fe-2S domain-containing protein [Formicincola oecophyllae]|uniref:Rieske 2Fe-2S domain-containing protein n=1 Tax=Formicincola oecophyllae TaxID=2558361 RepID=A0A4Y6UCJ8_9PROT|nr:FAD-dependent oxidoreductase [Formicincola oecophyllae]QDH13845.1 Rieske 2Fe-2S domain-containing protein [Formicincola oecophyllae]